MELLIGSQNWKPENNENGKRNKKNKNKKKNMPRFGNQKSFKKKKKLSISAKSVQILQICAFFCPTDWHLFC